MENDFKIKMIQQKMMRLVDSMDLSRKIYSEIVILLGEHFNEVNENDRSENEREIKFRAREKISATFRTEIPNENI